MWPLKNKSISTRQILRNKIEQSGWCSLTHEELTSVYEHIKEQSLIIKIVDHLMKENNL
jgi:hypothetical protein